MVNESDYFKVTTITCANPECRREIDLPGGLFITKTTKLYCMPRMEDGKIHRCTPSPPNWKEIFKGIKTVINDEDTDAANQANAFCDSDHCELPPITIIPDLPAKERKPLNIQLLNQGC